MKKVAEANRTHIAVIGKRNVGKSSLVNTIVNQDLSIVSDVAGTTTDPVKKSFELLPYGPVVIIDTAGIDDEGELGQKRISKTFKVLSESDFAIIVIDSRNQLDNMDIELINYLKRINISYIVVINKFTNDISPILLEQLKKLNIIYFEISCKDRIGIDELKKNIIRLLPSENEPPLIRDIVSPGDIVVMVVPIDLGAPKGRLILPQVQTIREALDTDTIVIVCKDKELKSTLSHLKEYPQLVITDSQAIMNVSVTVPDEVKLTTFSILMARHKGDLSTFVEGLKKVDKLENGDKVLIAEACSHHAQADDIGTVKIPRWLKNYTRKDLQIDIAHGFDFPENISDYKLIIHCGGCMITRKAMLTRINESKLLNIPIVNYGIIISYIHGAIPRALLPFKEAIAQWNKINNYSLHTVQNFCK